MLNNYLRGLVIAPAVAGSIVCASPGVLADPSPGFGIPTITRQLGSIHNEPIARSLKKRSSPSVPPDVIDHRLGGCPEGPPCPPASGTPPPAAPAAEPADCGDGNPCPKVD